jgi:DNA polymerase-3 subunit epsilon
MGFINAELEKIQRPVLPMDRAIDTLTMARRKFPGAQANLDALCRRFEINNSHRDLHGALIDADLLAGVYIELLGGRQPGLSLATEATSQSQTSPKNADAPSWHPDHRQPTSTDAANPPTCTNRLRNRRHMRRLSQN